ncbi:hypothetical protein ILUMI_17123, partial [Ignelater luminosus]
KWISICGLQSWNPNSINFSKCLGKKFNKINESVSNSTQDQFSKSQNIIGYEMPMIFTDNPVPAESSTSNNKITILQDITLHEFALSLPSQDTNMEKGEEPHKSISVDDTGLEKLERVTKIEDHLIYPKTPQRLGKRQTERTSIVLTSTDYNKVVEDKERV